YGRRQPAAGHGHLPRPAILRRGCQRTGRAGAVYEFGADVLAATARLFISQAACLWGSPHLLGACKDRLAYRVLPTRREYVPVGQPARPVRSVARHIRYIPDGPSRSAADFQHQRGADALQHALFHRFIQLLRHGAYAGQVFFRFVEKQVLDAFQLAWRQVNGLMQLDLAGADRLGQLLVDLADRQTGLPGNLLRFHARLGQGLDFMGLVDRRRRRAVAVIQQYLQEIRAVALQLVRPDTADQRHVLQG